MGTGTSETHLPTGVQTSRGSCWAGVTVLPKLYLSQPPVFGRGMLTTQLQGPGWLPKLLL